MQFDPSLLELPFPTEAIQVLEAFQALVSTGPVFVGPHMGDINHTTTNTPLVRYSPLVRMALVATNLGGVPLVFDEAKIHTCTTAVVKFQPPTTPVMQALAAKRIPTLSFHWCGLNSMFFVEEVMHGVLFPAKVYSTVNPNIVGNVLGIRGTAKVDPKNPAHLDAIEQVLQFLKTQPLAGGAAEQLERELQLLRFLTDQPGSTWEMGENTTHAEALEQVNITAQRWMDEAQAAIAANPELLPKSLRKA